MTLAKISYEQRRERTPSFADRASRVLVWGILAAVLAFQSLVAVHPVEHARTDPAHPCALCAAANIAPIPESCPEAPAAALVPVDTPQTPLLRYTAALLPTRLARAPPIAG